MVPAWLAAKLTLPGAHSSAGERPLHTREVPGSIPGAPIASREGLIAFVVDRYLGKRGAYLRADLREDLQAYLIGETWRLYKKFNPSRP
jgi:hypothetical protein